MVGWVCVVFVVDAYAYARRIIGWRRRSSRSTQLILDALDHAVWTRQRDGHDQPTSHNTESPDYPGRFIPVAGATPRGPSPFSRAG